MEREVTLRVPTSVYQQAKEQADATNRDVEELLSSLISEAFSAEPVASQDEKMLREQAAFEQMQEELVARFEGEYVAIHEGQVVAHAADVVELAERVDERYGSELVHIRRVTAKSRPPLRVRSPRWVRE